MHFSLSGTLSVALPRKVVYCQPFMETNWKYIFYSYVCKPKVQVKPFSQPQAWKKTQFVLHKYVSSQKYFTQKSA